MRNGFMHNPFIGEFMGTLVVVLRGNGVVANVSLNKSKAPTKYGPRPAAGPLAETCFEKMAAMLSTRSKVSISSARIFATAQRIAGPVLKQASFKSLCGVTAQ